LHGPALVDFLESLEEDQRQQLAPLLQADASSQQQSVSHKQSIPKMAGELQDAATIDPYATQFLRNRKATHSDVETEAPFVHRSATTRPAASEGDHVRYFGEYELLSEIARGGMGVIFKARQVSLNRIVALKMILSGNLAGSEEISRFRIEAEAAAKLEHWGIVPIYEIGEHDGQHYFSMGLVEGRSLQDRIHEGLLEPREAAALCSKITEAIAYAHDNGVIHRDLKPANVLLDLQGQPKITDFGLAKQVQKDSNLTRTGAVMGTPGYMPPEQAIGDSDAIGPLADVYSLGAILYAMLTGRPPFQSANVMDTLRQVMDQDPVPPKQLNPALDQDLQTICLKCLEKPAGKRYESAHALVDELQRYLAGEPILARPVSRVERAWRWCKRKPALASMAAAVASLLCLLSIGGPLVALQQSNLKSVAVEARDEAELRRREADEQRLQAVQAQAAETVARQQVEKEQQRVAGLLYSARISLAHREWFDNNPTRTQQLLNECPAEQRSWEWHYIDGLLRSEEMLILAHAVPASVQFLPSGGQLLTRGQSDNQIKLWDVASGLETRAKQVHQLSDADFPLDDKHVLVMAADTVVYNDVETGQAESYGKTSQRVTDAKMLDEGRRVIVAYADGSIVVYSRPEGKELFRAPHKLKSEPVHEFSADGKLVCGIEKTTLKVWDVETGDIKFEITGHVMKIQDAKFSPDGRLIAVADGSGAVSITEVATGRRLQMIRAHESSATVVEFSRDSRRLATGSQDHTARIFDVSNGDQLLIVRGHSQQITDLDFHPDGTRLVTASGDGSVRIWDIRDRITKTDRVAKILDSEHASHLGHKVGLESRVFYGHEGPVYDCGISPDGRFATTTGIGNQGDQQVCVWDLKNGTVHAGFPVPDGYLHTVGYTQDSRNLIVASGGAGDAVARGAVTIWDLTTKEKVRQLEGNACMFAQASVNAQNDLLAVMFGNLNYGELRIYSFPACELQHKSEITGERLSTLAFSASGNEVLAATLPGGKIRVWNARTGEQTADFQAHGTGVFRIAVSSDNKLATANNDGTIGLWDWKNKELQAELRGHSVYCIDLDFSPDGTRLVSSSEDGTVKVWSVQTHTELLSFRDHRMSAMGADWSDDGSTIATVSRDGSLILRELNQNIASATAETLDTWMTLFEDDFERSEVGDSWNYTDSQWRIENGRLLGTLEPTNAGASFFPAAYCNLRNLALPRTVDISVDIELKQPLLSQIVLRNAASEQSINPFIATVDQPFGFQGSSVLTMRGLGEAKLLGSRTQVEMVAGKTYRLRVVRVLEDLKFYLDDQLLEHVRVPMFEAEMLQLGGSWSANGDQLTFDNLLVRILKSAEKELKIRKQISDWLATRIMPDLVEQEIARVYTAPDDRRLAEAFLKSLRAGRSVGPEALVAAFAKVASRRDASAEEYDVAARQADFFLEHKADWWQWPQIALAWLRAGRTAAALERLDLAAEACQEHDGHLLPLVLVGRALTLHELGRNSEAKDAHRKLLDLMHADWRAEGIEDYLAELKEKVPVAVDPLQEELVQKLIASDHAFWYGRDMRKSFADKATDLVAVHGRGREPDQYDRKMDRATFMKLNAIFSAFQPPPKVHLIWDQIQFSRTDATARIEWVAISKFEEMVFRVGQWFEFENRDGNWLVARERSWQIDRHIGGEWTRFDKAHWANSDANIERLESEIAAAKGLQTQPRLESELAATFMHAQRFPEALEWASKVAKASRANAGNLAVLSEAAVNTGNFDLGLKALEFARRADPSVQMPWFATRMDRCYFDLPSVVFGIDFHPTEELMATCHQNQTIAFWNPSQNKVIRKIEKAHGAHVTDIAFSLDGTKVVSIGWDNAINISDTETGKRLQQFTGHLGQLFRLEHHPTKPLVVTASADNTAKVWDSENSRELFSLAGHTKPVMSATFSPEGSQLATGSADGTIRLWDATNGAETAQIEAHGAGVWRVDYTPDGKSILSCGREGKVRMWDAKSLKQITQFDGHESHVEVVRVSPDGKLAASADVDGLIFIWDLLAKKSIGTLRGHRGAIFNLQFNNGWLYSVSADRTIRRWDINFDRSPLQAALDRLDHP
jgi:WD40 repeat protein/serine/threonine protein kinase